MVAGIRLCELCGEEPLYEGIIKGQHLLPVGARVARGNNAHHSIRDTMFYIIMGGEVEPRYSCAW
jgi:hypothetical protein